MVCVWETLTMLSNKTVLPFGESRDRLFFLLSCPCYVKAQKQQEWLSEDTAFTSSSEKLQFFAFRFGQPRSKKNLMVSFLFLFALQLETKKKEKDWIMEKLRVKKQWKEEPRNNRAFFFPRTFFPALSLFFQNFCYWNKISVICNAERKGGKSMKKKIDSRKKIVKLRSTFLLRFLHLTFVFFCISRTLFFSTEGKLSAKQKKNYNKKENHAMIAPR